MKKPKYTVNIDDSKYRLHFTKEDFYKILEHTITAFIMDNRYLDEKGRFYRDKIAKVKVEIIEKENIEDVPIIIEVR